MTTMPTLDSPVAEAAWSIRPELPIDLDLIHDLHREAFPTSEMADLVDAVRSSASFVPTLSLVAVAGDGTVLGHALMSRVDLVPDGDDASRVPVLALGPVAVLPPHQGRGIGRALLTELLDEADTLPEPLSVVHGAPALFAVFGYRPATESGIRGPFEEEDPGFAVRFKPGDGAAPRGTVVYPPGFASQA
jgi:putative acetyltransferase